MEKIKILTETSPWFILACLIAGLAYAYFLYTAKSPWNKTTNRFLFGLRFLIVSLICFLLTGPLIQLIKNFYEKPSIVVAVDNSESVKLTTDSLKLKELLNNTQKLINSIKDLDYEVEVSSLTKNISDEDLLALSYSEKTTNISAQLSEIENNFENRNLAGVILLSDGIYNSGYDPMFKPYNFPVYSIGLGDTSSKKDLKLKNLVYNKIAYTGNKFPIIAEIQNSGYQNEVIKVRLLKSGKVLEERKITLNSRNIFETEFYTSTEKPGLQHYVVEIKPLAGEFTLKNNIAHAYIEVIDAKEKILLAAQSPHPDIKALKGAIETKENYQVDLYIPGISELQEAKYDLVILHQIPDSRNISRQFLQNIDKLTSSKLYIVGNQSNLTQLNQINKVLEITPRGRQNDLVTPGLNPLFEKFNITENKEILSGYPPVQIPFGDYKLKGGAESILYQKIGAVQTQKPLLASKTEGGSKTAVLTGEGIWQWRLEEYKATGKTIFFDNFFTSVVQFLSSKEDKRKFRLYPIQNEFQQAENVVFETQIYNDVFEKVFNRKVSLNIKNEEGKVYQYSFINSEENSRFTVKGLKPGLYYYTGTTELNNKTLKASGEFLIQETVLEALNTQANHSMLQELSKKSGGKFYDADQISNIEADLKNKENKAIIHSREELQDIINFPWLLVLLIALASAEWFVRKYTGGY